MRHILYIGPAVLLLWLVDSVVSKDRTIGWERNGVLDAQKRWQSGRGKEAILLGSSTSVDWLRPNYVERIFDLRRGSVVDAHINGCHQDCTYAQVRRLLAGTRSYRRAFYGTNQFQLCEFEHSKRVLQQQMMIPSRDIPALFGIYTRADKPLNFMARFIGISLSGVYGDTLFLQGRWAEDLFGKPPSGKQHLWYQALKPERPPPHWCDYDPKKIAYKKALSEALLDDLGVLVEQVYLILLPDETLSSPDRKIIGAWNRHRRLHRRLAESRKHVVLLDLSRGGAHGPHHFRDGFHVNAAGMKAQQQLFERLLRDGGYIKPPREPEGNGSR